MIYYIKSIAKNSFESLIQNKDIAFCLLFFSFLFFLPVKVDIYNGVGILYIFILLTKKKIYLYNLYDEFIFIIIGFWIISFISSLYNNLATNTTFDILTAIFPYLFAKFLKYENINKYLLSFIIILLLVCIICFFKRFGHTNFNLVSALFFKNISRSSLFLACGILISLFLSFKQEKILLKYIFLTISLFFIPFIFSLQELTSLAAVVLCVCILLFKMTSKRYTILIILFASIVLVLFTNNKFKTLSNKPLSHVTVNHRYNMWIAAINMFKEKPLLGQGYKSFKKKYTYYLDKKNMHYDPSIINGGYQDAHNITLHLLAETGILGALLITLMFIYIFYIGIWKFSTNCMLFISSLCILLIYLNMQLHVHLDVNSVRALLFFFIGLFKNSLSHIQNDH